ncbi:PD-(D/E)XK nuclease family protein [Candidatus Microgenomates bacterium]|nr:PD-(D/E)XK nuclease family protein [Candidatus Microgenomates bacterium]
MNKYKQRKGNLYNPKSTEPFRISRSRMEGFLGCPRCFYLDRRIGLDRPGLPGWSLNDAVDHLLKNEFDLLRKDGKKHALMEEYGIDAIPFQHPDLPEWRDDHKRFVGACVLHKPTNLEICGIIDDIWVNPKGQLHIVDYKSTSTSKEISLDDEYKQGYKKQVEWYQWIFRQKGFDVSDIAYFVYANGLKGDRVFDAKIEFEVQIISHKGDASWVEPTIFAMKDCLNSDNIPDPYPDCEFCQYRRLIKKEE